jgi:glycosyltransferase involved in cell wall biosynthesis
MKQASETGIADHILWLGEHRDVDRYLRATDIAVLCSHEEGFSNSLIEAMAFGIPVIATAVGGNLDAVVPEESGLLVPSRAPTELAAAILHMATKPEFRALCGASARRRVQENFSLAACTQRYANLYRGIELVAQDGVQAVIDPHHYGIRREAVAAARGLRIVHVIPDLGIGGAERMLAQLAISADYVNVQEIVIVTLLPGGFYVDQIRDAGIQVVVLDCSSLLGLITSLIKLVRLISRLQPNIVQGWMYYGDFAALLALSLSRARKNAQLLWTIRCSGMEFDLYRRRLRATVWACRRLSSWPNLVVANSAAGLEAHRHMGYHPRRTQVIANGIDTERFQPDKATRREVRNELGIPDDAILLIHVARVDPMKDHQTLLAAMAKLPDIHALVVGFGTERLLVTPNVQCLGVRTDLPRLYPAADFVVSSSAFGEGFSNVIGEGMASGLPAIATDVGDARIIIGETGVVVPPRDADALALAVRSLASERPRERILRSTRARARVVEKFSLANAIAQFDELYSRVASRQPSDRHERT